MAHTAGHQMSEEMRRCIDECSNCHRVCLETVTYCLQKGGRHVEARHLGLLLDCAEVCQTSADFMLRGSPFHTVTCAACAELCRACEEACRAVEDDEQMAHCADVCGACAESCSRMADMGGEEEDE